MQVERIVFDGREYRRYPESGRRCDRVYFTHNNSRKKIYLRLHREIWRKCNGEIPEGYDIHHVDGNPLNNEISNLECKERSKHHSDHGYERENDPKWIKMAQEAAKEWHRSDAGRAWHSLHAKEIWNDAKPVESQCDECGASYKTIIRHGRDRFCSNKCKTRNRLKSGVDNVSRDCVVCGKTFVINKYTKTQSCSRKCTGKVISKAKRAA